MQKEFSCGQDRTAGTGQPGQDSQDRTAGTDVKRGESIFPVLFTTSSFIAKSYY